MTPNHLAIELVDVTKQYSDVLAADSVSFKVRDGEFFGLLGPNGAGKTTTINMMTSILKPSKGKIRILGLDVKKKSGRSKEKCWSCFSGFCIR